MVNEVTEMFGLPESPKHNAIQKDQVLQWMQDEDIDTLGAVYAYIMNKKYAERIQPTLTFEDYYPFVIRYFERCFRENIDKEWADTRYGAGHALVGWFASLWVDISIPRTVLTEIKNWLANVYLSADEELKQCIVNAVLEHLFENSEIMEFFSDWKNNPVLEQAYTNALKWTS